MFLKSSAFKSLKYLNSFENKVLCEWFSSYFLTFCFGFMSISFFFFLLKGNINLEIFRKLGTLALNHQLCFQTCIISIYQKAKIGSIILCKPTDEVYPWNLPIFTQQWWKQKVWREECEGILCVCVCLCVSMHVCCLYGV